MTSVSPPNLAPRQFGKNLAVNVASQLTSIATGFLLAPYLVRRLGVAGYGLAPLISGVVSYLHVANIALNSAAVRHLSVALARDERDRASEIFNTSLWGSVAVAAGLMLAGVVASLNAARIIVVPAGYEVDASIIFLTTTGTVALTLVSAPLSVAIYYSNRLDKKGMIDLVNRLTYVLLVVALVSLLSARPMMVGLATLAATLVGTVQTASWSRRCLPWLRVRLVFHWQTLKEMTWFGGWSLAAYGGNLLFLSTDLIIINRLLGPGEAGIYAILLQWPGLLRVFAATVSNVFSQPMAYVYGRDGASGLYEYCLGAVRRTSALALIPAVAIGGCAEPLLRLWLGSSFAVHWRLLALMVLPLGFGLATSPLVAALQAMLQVRALGILTMACGLANVGLAVLLIKTTSLGTWAVAIASTTNFVALSCVLLPILAAKAFERPRTQLIAVIAKAAAVTVVAALIGAAASGLATPMHWWSLAVQGALLVIAAALMAAYVILRPEERTFIAERMRSGRLSEILKRSEGA